MTKKNPSIEDFKTPFYVAIGAGDLALAAVADVVTKLRERAEEAATEAGARVDGTRGRLRELSTELPADVSELRDRFTSEELRKVAEAYLQVATDIYNNLAERGEGAFDRLRTTTNLDENVNKANELVGSYAELTEQALGTVASQTRAVGERAAKLVGLDLSTKEAPVEESAAKKVPAKAAAKAPAKKAAAKAPAKKAAAKKVPAKAPAKKVPAKKASPTITQK